jgi:hypothetical protein
MTAHETHDAHHHEHGPGCGHPAVAHDGHTDFAHDGHLHHQHDGHVDEHVLDDSDANPAACTPAHACGSHDDAHDHGEQCEHVAVPHAEHTDYLVDGHLHHPHEGHCDDHGAVRAS